MPGEANAMEILTEKIDGIPLYLISTTIAGQIKKKRESVFQIKVERKFFHSYTIIVETRDEYALRVNQEALAYTEGEGHG
ncbi:MAG: hypothetical protein Q8N94_10815 [Methanoregula sp.]|nr:hypothetical protein [Methanoregula sp.]